MNYYRQGNLRAFRDIQAADTGVASLPGRDPAQDGRASFARWLAHLCKTNSSGDC